MVLLKSKPPKLDARTAAQRSYWRYIAARPAQRMPIIRGQDSSRWKDVYHGVLRAPWSLFVLGIAAVFILLNLAFAGLYHFDPAGITHARAGSFWDEFLFSVQTMGAINSEMTARSTYTNLVVSSEAFFSIMNMALITGIVFARFSRPSARVVFSNVAVVLPYDGVPTLMFRAANQRGNQIMDASIMVALARQSMSQEGLIMRRIEDLPLVRSRSLLFSLSWTVMHRIDETSPLYGATRESLEAGDAQIFVLLSGRDDSLADTIYARHFYAPADVLWDRRFVDVLGQTDEGRRVVDLTRFHQTEPFPGPASTEMS